MDDTAPHDDDLAALSSYASDLESDASDLDALDGYEGADGDFEEGDLEEGDLEECPKEDESTGATFTVTNPPGTVTVSTLMDGRVRQIDLTQEVTSMTETDLSEEIVVIAKLATQAARAAQYGYVLENMSRQGHDDVATRDFLARDLDLPSPEDVSAARARVFAMRYAGDHD